MLVKVIPVKPIPGILPKNKYIDCEMILDLNKNEIIHCMQYGNVYDENETLIDAISIHKKTVTIQKIKPVETIKINKIEPIIVKEVPEVATIELVATENNEEVVIDSKSEPITDPIFTYVEEVIEEDKEESYFKLEEVSCVKEDNYVILETQMNTNSKLEGNLYGLLSITSGSRPVIEYKVNNEWTKINNKFSNFNSIENGDKFVFRFTPKNENEFSYKIVIKEANEVLVKLEEKINSVEL